jgi:uncharacterized delta-60 repeat protein
MGVRFLSRLSLAVLAALVPAQAAFAAPSDLDRTFGTFGRAFPQFPTSIGAVGELIPLPDGRMLGATSGIVRFGPVEGSVFRITRAGALDSTFGTGGAVSFSGATSSGNAAVNGMVRQPDGGIVVLGGNPIGWPHFALARFLSDGTLDATFGSSGKVESDAINPIGLAMQPDGALVVAVSACTASGTCRSGLLRYSAGGVPDRGFGGDGTVRIPFADVDAVAVQRDGRVVVAGSSPDTRLALARYRADGSADPTFGSGGDAPAAGSRGFDAVAGGIVVQSDGKAVIAVRDTAAAATRSWLLRYRGDGSLDRGFGVRGAARISDVSVTGLVRQPNGKLVVVGVADLGAAFGVVRLRANGRRDRGFGRRGRMLTDLDPEYNIEQVPGAVAIGPASRITVGGGIGFPDSRPVLVRYKGGPSVVGGSEAKGRYVVRISRTSRRGGRGAFHRGDVARVRLEDRRGRTQRYDLCFAGPPLSRGSCSEDRRTGRSVVSRTLAQAGHWTLRFRIQATGEVILHRLRVYAPARNS